MSSTDILSSVKEEATWDVGVPIKKRRLKSPDSSVANVESRPSEGGPPSSLNISGFWARFKSHKLAELLEFTGVSKEEAMYRESSLMISVIDQLGDEFRIFRVSHRSPEAREVDSYELTIGAHPMRLSSAPHVIVSVCRGEDEESFVLLTYDSRILMETRTVFRLWGENLIVQQTSKKMTTGEKALSVSIFQREIQQPPWFPR